VAKKYELFARNIDCSNHIVQLCPQFNPGEPSTLLAHEDYVQDINTHYGLASFFIVLR